MRHAPLWRSALALLYGVAPIQPLTDPCLKAPLHRAPATESEWQATTFDIEDMRVYRPDERWPVQLGSSWWSTDALVGVARPTWWGGRRIPSDTLAIAWSEIERIERPAGRKVLQGTVLGALVGLGVGMVAIAVEDHEPCGDTFCMPAGPFVLLFGVPIGAIVGAGIGATVRSWKPFYCAGAPSESEPD